MQVEFAVEFDRILIYSVLHYLKDQAEVVAFVMKAADFSENGTLSADLMRHRVSMRF